MRRFFVSLLILCSVYSCKSRDDASNVLEGEPNTAISATECPPYVYKSSIDHAIGSPDELTRDSAGLPIDVRTKSFDLDPYGFECFGACGRSCNATCSPMPAVTRVYRISYGDQGQEKFKRCVYEVKGCRTHPSCRSHDNCYREKDQGHWLSNNSKDTSAGPSITFSQYRKCDAPLSTSRCTPFWMTGNAPSRTLLSCWDMDLLMFARLKTEEDVNPTAEELKDLQIETYDRKGKASILSIALATDEAPTFFENSFSRCHSTLNRLPTIQELEKLQGELRDKNIINQCVWSITSSMDPVNSRYAYRINTTGETIQANPFKVKCRTVCVAN